MGIVIDEYLDEFHRGDFLIRNLIGVDPNSGAIAVGALPRAGQTLQFQRRDARSAGEDFDELLHQAKESFSNTTVYGGCLFCWLIWRWDFFCFSWVFFTVTRSNLTRWGPGPLNPT